MKPFWIAVVVNIMFIALFIEPFPNHPLHASGVDLSVYYGSRYSYLGGQQVPIATDAYAPFYNPAGMAFAQDRHVAINSSNLLFQFEAPLGAPQSKKTSEWGHAPLFYAGFIAPLSDRLTAGIAFFPTSLQGAEFTNVQVGTLSNKTVGTRLVRLELAPSISFKIVEHLSVGASFRPAYTSSETKAASFASSALAASPAYYDSSVSGFDGKGFKFGLHLEKFHGLSAGITYRTPVSVTLDGSSDYTNPLGAGTSPTRQRIHVPAQMQVGLAYDFTSQWMATFTYEWTQNSVYKSNGLHMTAVEEALTNALGSPVSTETSLGWKDGHGFHFGSEYSFRLAADQRLNAGLGLVLDKAVTLKSRPIPGVAPSADYYGTCWGAQYIRGVHSFGMAFNYGTYGHTSTDPLDAGSNPAAIFAGKYHLTTFMASADYQFRF